jgi:hypothetical protein
VEEGYDVPLGKRCVLDKLPPDMRGDIIDNEFSVNQ